MAYPYVIFEIANVHGGDLDHLDRLVEVYAGFDYPRKGIKFQAFHADTLALPDFSYYGLYQKLTQEPEAWERLIEKAAESGEVWLDVFDTYGTDIMRRCSDQVAGVKLQASVLDNAEVVAGLREGGMGERKLMINIAGHDLARVHQYVEEFSQLGPRELILQAGFQGYPTSVSETGLQKVAVLRTAFPELPICFADHAPAASEAACSMPALAVVAGGSYVEKHFCTSREEAVYDAHSALEPGEMSEMLARLRTAVEASSGPFVNDAEMKYLKGTYQAPIVKKPLPAGSLVSKEDLLFRRTDQEGLTWPALQERQQGFRVLRQDLGEGKTIAEGSFRDARIGVIVACRMKSSRLEQKAILPLHGVPSVERCLQNCLMMEEADTVVLATSDLEEDAVLADYTLGGRAEFVQGDPDDVIQRYLDACDRYDIDVVVRVTADCPVVSPEITTYLLQSHFATGADYSAAAACAVGSAGEVINVEALRRVIQLTGGAAYSEYMTWYFQNNPDIFKVNLVDLPERLVRDYRLTLDYPEDKEMFEGLFDRLEAEGRPSLLTEVFAVLDADPKLAALNQHLGLRYRTDEDLIALLNEKTRIAKAVA